MRVAPDSATIGRDRCERVRKVMSIESATARHYGRSGVATIILEALAAAGKDTARLTLEDLAPIDEFHVRGRAATVELAAGLELAAGMIVLDVGCGIGGPSRYVAATHGDQVEYRQGGALAMPFPDRAFDAAYSQHVAMKHRGQSRAVRRDCAGAEAGHALRPLRPAPGRGRRGPVSGALGERVVEARAWADQLEARMAEPAPPPSALRLLLGPDAAPMARNLFSNLREDRVLPAEIICRKRSSPAKTEPRSGCRGEEPWARSKA